MCIFHSTWCDHIFNFLQCWHLQTWQLLWNSVSFITDLISWEGMGIRNFYNKYWHYLTRPPLNIFRFFLFLSRCVRCVLSTEIEVHEAVGIQHSCEVICFSKKRLWNFYKVKKKFRKFLTLETHFFFWKYYLLV